MARRGSGECAELRPVLAPKPKLASALLTQLSFVSTRPCRIYGRCFYSADEWQPSVSTVQLAAAGLSQASGQRLAKAADGEGNDPAIDHDTLCALARVSGEPLGD